MNFPYGKIGIDLEIVVEQVFSRLSLELIDFCDRRSLFDLFLRRAIAQVAKY